MKRIKSINGYTIYQATARDVTRHNVEEGYFYLYFSSDIRDFGLSYSYIEMEAASLEEAEALATGSNYAAAREYVEASSTAADFEEIAEIEKKLDSGMTLDEIEAEAEEAEEAEATFIEEAETAGHVAVRDTSSEEIIVGPARAVYYALRFRRRFARYHGEPLPCWEPLTCGAAAIITAANK
jgi:hypothetical protein